MDEFEMIQKLADCYNDNSFEPLRSILEDDCHYASQWVFEEMVGKDKITDYLVAKSIRIASSGSIVHADIGTIKNPYAGRKCLVMHQDSEKVSCLILIEIRNEKITRIDICIPELFAYSID